MGDQRDPEDGYADHEKPSRPWCGGAGPTRRAFVGGTLGASVAALAGCAGAGVESPTRDQPGTDQAAATGTATGGGSPTGDGRVEEELPEGVSEEEFISGPVPEPYRTAESQGGNRRDPENLQTKQAVRFQEAEAAVDAGLITPGPHCGNCAEYVPDMNGDGFGACAKVEGYIDPQDWCAIWQPLDGGN